MKVEQPRARLGARFADQLPFSVLNGNRPAHAELEREKDRSMVLDRGAALGLEAKLSQDQFEDVRRLEESGHSPAGVRNRPRPLDDERDVDELLVERVP